MAEDRRTTAGLFLPYVYGRGYPTLNPTLTPSAGAASVLKVPGSRNFRLLSVSGVLTTSAVAGSRGLFLEWMDADSNIYCHVPMPVAVAVSSTARFTFSGDQVLAVAGADGSLTAPAPQMITPMGHQIRVSWSAQDPGDALSLVRWYYDELLLGGDGYAPGIATSDAPRIHP